METSIVDQKKTDLINSLKEKYTNFKLINFSDLSVGNIIQIFYRIPEGEKERIQLYEGIIISKNNNNFNKSFTIRRFVDGIGLEQIFTFNSPKIVKIIKKNSYKVRKAKLYFLRKNISQSIKLKDKK
jgi:large subunit ribosomal protein L19